MSEFERSVMIGTSADDLFAWHARPGAFERLEPPWESIEVVEREGTITDGSRLVMEIKKGPLRLRWEAVHRDYEFGRKFCDVQVRGPFDQWVHCHVFEPVDECHSRLIDKIEYREPMGAIGRTVLGRKIRNDLDRLFHFRHARTRDDLKRHQQHAGSKPLTVAITGSGGLIGRALSTFLESGGHRVLRIKRDRSSDEHALTWDPSAGIEDPTKLEGVDAFIHLAGDNIASGRWTTDRKQAIRDNRTIGTRVLAESLAGLSAPPRVFLCASAIGYYGHRGNDVVDESSPSGRGFLPDVCRDWEAAAAPARDAGIRTVNLRIGIVLATKGGALASMLPPFKMGGGGVIGSGEQHMSWIALDDVVGAIHHLIFAHNVEGPVNLVSPNPVTNREFTKTLGRVLKRPTFVPMPAFAVRLAFGEMGQELLLEGAHVKPAQLLESGFTFLTPNLEPALRSEIGLYTS